jgi:nifR3 family TIM-barrel protein
MQDFLNSSWSIGGLLLPNRLIQGPLAGYSCAPFRQLFNYFLPPAYCVTEMISAVDALHKHSDESRYLYRDPSERLLCYQLSGTDAEMITKAALRVARLGADLIDLNCGCPKPKIRKKGAGSALLDNPTQLLNIIRTLRAAIRIPFTVKVRIFGDERDIVLAQRIEEAGADALIVHGRRVTDDYDTPCNLSQIARIKQALSIPVIANGDIADTKSLQTALIQTGCDAYMIGRAGCGKPWLYQQLLTDDGGDDSYTARVRYLMMHIDGLSRLESSAQAVLQSKSLARYYFKGLFQHPQWLEFYALNSIPAIQEWFIAQQVLV